MIRKTKPAKTRPLPRSRGTLKRALKKRQEKTRALEASARIRSAAKHDVDRVDVAMHRLPVAMIKIGKRYRKDFGDLAALATSINERGGLIHPIAVTPKNELIAGERRLRAWKLSKFGKLSIPAHIIDIDSIVAGEWDENAPGIRKDFTLSEAVDIKRALEPLEKVKAAERMKAGRAIAPSQGKGEAAVKVARMVGMDRKTIAKAEAVVDAARDNPKKFGGLLEQMDRTGRAHGPFKRLTVMRQTEQIRKEPPPLPGKGPYRAGVIDLPWASEPDGESPSETGRGYFNYPTMTTVEMIAMGPAIRKLLHPSGAWIWFWVTNFHLVKGHAFEVLDAWKFERVHIRTWVKDKVGRGQVLRGQTEHVILCKVGSPPAVNLTNQTTAMPGKVRGDSEKPENFYNDVEALTPAPRYFELFARRKLPKNWDGHGDQVGTLGEKLIEASADVLKRLSRMLKPRALWREADLIKLAEGSSFEALLGSIERAAEIATATYDRAGTVRKMARAVADKATHAAAFAAEQVKGRSEAKLEAKKLAAAEFDGAIAKAAQIVKVADDRMRELINAAFKGSGLEDGATVIYRGKLHDGRDDQWIKDPRGTVTLADTAVEFHADRFGDVAFFGPEDLPKLKVAGAVPYEGLGNIPRGQLRVLSAIEAGEPIDFNENDQVMRGLYSGKHKRKLTLAGMRRLAEVRAWAAKVDAPARPGDPLTRATSGYQAELGYADDGDCRITPAGQMDVNHLVKPGNFVCTSYDTGPDRVVEVTGPFRHKHVAGVGRAKVTRKFSHWSLCLCRPAVKPRKDGSYKADSWVNEIVAVDGRLLKLFTASADEVFVGVTAAAALGAKRAARKAARAAGKPTLPASQVPAVENPAKVDHAIAADASPRGDGDQLDVEVYLQRAANDAGAKAAAS